MSDKEFTSYNPEDDETKQELQQSVRQLGELFGLHGLDVVIEPGTGWKCIKTPKGITITVDPEQLIERRGPDGQAAHENAEASQTDSRYILHTTAHEISHGKDFVDPQWHSLPVKSSDHFFWNVLDDAVIDKRLRNVPALDDITDQLYSQVLFPTDDLADQPKHVQFMHGLLLDTVTNNPLPAIDPSVAEKLQALKQYEANGDIFNIFDTLADPRTTLRERRAIARHLVMPTYKELLEQDQQEQKQPGKQGDGDGEGGEGFEQHYEQYEQTMHGEEHEHSDDKPQEQKDESDTQPTDHALQIAAVLQENTEPSDQTDGSLGIQATDYMPPDPQHQEAIDNLAGTVATEMKLEPGDARLYVDSLDKWSQTIRQASDVFLQLAAPTVTTMSPRYEGRALPEGARLHPQRLAQAALQLVSDQEQPIWQPIERRANRQKIAFGGLDIHLLVDVSGSMANGGKATCASACSQILLEGIQLASHKAVEAGPQQTQPDVRTQVVAFGSDTQVLAPLAFQPTEPQKGAVFSNLLRPNSGSTLISGALAIVHQNVAANPERESIVIIVSDGIFGDHDIAVQQVDKLPVSAYVSHLVVGGEAHAYISPNHQAILDPFRLPGTLNNILAGRIRRQ